MTFILHPRKLLAVTLYMIRRRSTEVGDFFLLSDFSGAAIVQYNCPSHTDVFVDCCYKFVTRMPLLEVAPSTFITVSSSGRERLH